MPEPTNANLLHSRARRPAGEPLGLQNASEAPTLRNQRFSSQVDPGAEIGLQDAALFDQRRWLSTLQELIDLPVTKFKRDRLHRIVHTFRELHGFKAGVPARENREYARVRLAYARSAERLFVEHPFARDSVQIRRLSSPHEYTSIRAAGRMRVSMPTLSPRELTRVCREIRAALMWLSEFKALCP